MNKTINIKIAIIFGLLLVISGCTPVGKDPTQNAHADHESLNETSNFLLLKDKVPDTAGASSSKKSVAEYIDGSGNFINIRKSSLKSYLKKEDGSIDLNFLESDVRMVMDAVLREMLEKEYILDPRVRGKITLQSNRSLNELDVLIALEEALRLINTAMIPQDGIYHIIPLKDAPRRIASLRRPSPVSKNLPGFGVEAISLEYITPTEMQKILQPFAPQGSILKVDNSRNLLILAGTATELSMLQELIHTFDVDWVKGMSFAMFPLESVDAKTIKTELLTIFDDANTPIKGMVKIIPMSRLNSLLVMSHSKEYLRKVERWIKRLDKAGQSGGRKIYVYSIQNGKAESVASSLNQIYGNEVGAGSSSSTTSQKASGRRAFSANSRNSQNKLKIVPNIEDNSLLILATPEEYGVISNALKQVDKPPRQVLIEATLAEVSLNNDLKYGVNWFFESGSSDVTFSGNKSGAISSVFPGFSVVHSATSGAKAALNALSSVTDVNVISSPKIMVLNNHTGMIQIGDQVPVIVRSSQGTGGENAPVVNNVEFRDTGVILNITPQINAGGLIVLEIEQEVSEVAETKSSGIDSPTIQQRKIKTTVAIQNGETIALGGLIRETSTNSKSGIPILKDIPLLGNLFSTTSKVKRRTELIILITPRIVNNVHEMRETLDDMKQEFKFLKKFPTSILKFPETSGKPETTSK